jgi:hypothetical protein
VRLAAIPPTGLGNPVGLAAGDPLEVGVLDEAEADADVDGEPCPAVSPGDPHALASRARTHTISPFLMSVASCNARALFRLLPRAR